MSFLPDEIRLTAALLLQAAALAGAWRFVRRRLATDWADRAADALLLALLVQYAAVCLPGLLHVLSPLSIAFTTTALSAVLWFAPTRQAPVAAAATPAAADRLTPLACFAFLAASAAGVAHAQNLTPVMASDALTYHFPAAVRWLQTGRLALFETWFFNPANAYSPLAGSAFVAWWIAPVGNDVLAKYVQAPALLLVFFAALRLARAVGARPALAAILALALALARPFIRQSTIEKDDLYLAAFFACVVAGCSRDRLADRGGLATLRLAAALGLLLATKYTALLALPALLFLIDAAPRARWPLRRYLAAAGLVLLIAGPWYLRNALLTGNPLYPVQTGPFPGLFATERSHQLRDAGSILDVLTRRDQSLPAAPAVVLLIALAAALVAGVRRLAGDPMTRTVLLGPVVGLSVFLASAPYAEVRFLFPAFVLLFAAAAVAITAWLARPPALRYAAGGLLLVLCWLTAYDLTGERSGIVAGITVNAAVVVALALALAWLLHRFPARRPAVLGYGGGLLALLYAAAVYAGWPAYTKARQVNAVALYRLQYGPLADAWGFVRDEIPPHEPVAYASTFLIHPLSGSDNARPLLYVPTRRGVAHLHDLPPLAAGPLSDDRINAALATALAADPDPDGWLARLLASPATHLAVFRTPGFPDPPESGLARARPARFTRVFENEAATVYRITRP